MKRRMIVLVLMALWGVALANCGSSGGGGGGSMFSASYEKSSQAWDLMLILENAACPKGFSGMAAGIDPSFPGGLFPGLSIISTGGMTFQAKVPEVNMLAYFVLAPGVISAGDSVHIHFKYRAQADGENGDYFLLRILDGDRFLVPVELRKSKMASGEVKSVNYSYRAKSDGFGIEFIVGLSQPTDQFYLDEFEVRAAGVQPGDTIHYVIKDYFEAGNYAVQAMLSPVVIRFPFRPNQPLGTFGLSNVAPLAGTQSLLITGGKYFDLYGQGASTDEFAGIVLTYTGANPLDPFFGQTMGMQQGSMYMGDYLGFDNAIAPTCTEQGYALIAVNPKGNADLSGLWTLRLDAFCEEAGVIVGETIGPPVVPGDPVSVFKQLVMFGGYPFVTADGDLIDTMMGLSMGNAGMFLLASTANATQAQLVGAYDPATGIFAGQIMGTLPAAGANICTVTQGQFTARIDKSVFVPPPLLK